MVGIKLRWMNWCLQFDLPVDSNLIREPCCLSQVRLLKENTPDKEAKQQTLIFHSSGGWGSKSRCWQIQALVKILFLASNQGFTGQRKRSSDLSSSSSKDTNPIMGIPLSWLHLNTIISQRPPSPNIILGVRDSTYEWGRGGKHSVYNNVSEYHISLPKLTAGDKLIYIIFHLWVC